MMLLNHRNNAKFLPRLGNRGFTLLEATLVLGILGIIVAGILIASGNAIAGQKRKHQAEQVITTVGNMRNYLKSIDLSTIPSGTLLTPDVIKLGLLPSDAVNGVNTGRNAYGGNLLVGFTTSNNQIAIGLENIPSDACVDLLYNHFGGSSNVTQSGGSSTGGSNTANDVGFLGYNRDGSAQVVTNASFTFATTNCAPNSGFSGTLYLYFSL